MAITQAQREALRHRLGEVDHTPGFQRLEVWRDTHRPGRYVMVTWWDTEHDYRTYMRSDAHRRSHDRIPTDPHPPRPQSLDRYCIIAR